MSVILYNDLERQSEVVGMNIKYVATLHWPEIDPVDRGGYCRPVNNLMTLTL